MLNLITGWLLSGLMSGALGCAPAVVEAPQPPLRVLFIGNSLTYVNDLPSMVVALGRRDRRPIEAESVAFPDFALEDHWHRGDALAALARGHWDVVVLQQGPSALPQSQINLEEWVGRFAAEIRRRGATPAVYMVWPPLGRDNYWNDVTASYTVAARTASATLLPAGEAIREARRQEPKLPLFAADGFHPALAGSYVAALVIFARLTGESPLGLSYRLGGAPVPSAQIGTLEAAAAAALERYPAH